MFSVYVYIIKSVAVQLLKALLDSQVSCSLKLLRCEELHYTVQLASKFTLNCETRTSARKIFKSARELLASARASLAKPLLASYMRVHAYCTSAKYSRAFVHVRT